MSQSIVAGIALIAFGAFMLGYGIGWRQCAVSRDEVDSIADAKAEINGAAP